MLSMNNDITALILENTLNNSTIGLNNSINQLTTGYKINRAKDNAAGYAIANTMNVKISSWLVARDNAENSLALLDTAEKSFANITNILQRLRDLSEEAANGVYSEDSRNAMQAEANQLIAQIKQIKANADYNGLKVLGSEAKDATAKHSTNNTSNPIKTLNNNVRIDGKQINTNTNKSEDVFEEINKLLNTYSSTDKYTSVNKQTNTIQTTSKQTISNNEIQTDENSSEGVDSVAFLAAARNAGELTGAIDFNGNETKTITIDGISYKIKNRLSTAQTFSYSKNQTSGEFKLICDSFEIYAQSDIKHNIVIAGRFNYVHGGDLDDTISTINKASSNYIYGGKGDDTIIIDNGGGSYAYGEDGDDTIINNSSGGYTISGGNGNDTITTSGSSYVYGGNGDDIINIKSNSNNIFAEVGNDTINIISGTNNLIDGGEGTNTVTGNTSGNTILNATGANSQGASFKAYETKNLTINGINYTVRNNSGSVKALIYTVNSSGQITFTKGSNFTITGDKTKAHNVVLNISSSTFNGGNLGDTILVNGYGNSIYGYGGDDIITINSDTNTVWGGDGNDNITVKSTRNKIYGEAGDDIININANSSTQNTQYADGGVGNDTINIASGVKNVIATGGSGTNTINNNGSNNLIGGFSETTDNAETITLANGETKSISINGISYTLKNLLGKENNFLYSFNPVTGEVTFGGCDVEIKGQTDVVHNIILYGRNLRLYTGQQADKIVEYGYTNTIYAGAGNDNITINGTSTTAYGEDGDDEITQNGSNTANGGNGNDTMIVNNGYSTFGGNGDDTYIINGGNRIEDSGGNNIYYVNVNNRIISGSSGDDTFYIKSSNNTIKGNGGNDYFVIDGGNNTVDGGSGRNYFVDNSPSGTNDFTNSKVDPNSGVLMFSNIGETKTFTMAGKTYTVKNINADGAGIANNELKYSYNANTGVITLNGSDFTITSDENQANRLNIRGNNNTINGSNLIDRITIEEGTNNIINGNDGDDVLISNSENNSLNGGNGNDVITINASTNKSVTGGEGNDTININCDNNTDINAGNGNDKITINGKNNSIDANSGNNTISTRGDNNTIKAGDGTNKISTVGNENIITAGNGDNTVGIQGDKNTITAKNATGTINIFGEENDITINKGDNSIIVRGNSNSFTTISGEKDIKVTGNNNDITTGTGNDYFDIKGNNNNIESISGDNQIKIKGNENSYQGGTGIDNVTIQGDKNTAKGGDSNDIFMISKGNDNIIDGEGGVRNTMINNGKKTTFNNVVDITPDPFKFDAKIGISSSKNTFISYEINFNLFDFSLDFSTSESSRENINLIDDLLNLVSDQVTNIGAMKNRLESVINSQNTAIDNLTASLSTVRDADISQVSSNFIKNQILQNATASLTVSSRNIRANNLLEILNSIRR